MEPVTAFGLAMNVCQAVEFGINVVKNCRRLHAGDIGHSALREQCQSLSECIEMLRTHVEAATPQTLAETCESNLVKASKECMNAAESLKEEAEKFLVPAEQHGKRWQTFKVALKISFGSMSIMTRKRDQLRGCRENLILSILVDLRSNNIIEEQQWQHFCRHWGSTAEVSTQIDKASERLYNVTMDQGILTRSHVTTEANRIRIDLLDAAAAEKAQSRNSSRIQKVLEHLSFAEMGARREEVRPAHERTFQWIFSTERDQKQRDSFSDWLKRDESIYWINGKPRSGKSTLMRFVLENPVTTRFLEDWSNAEVNILSSSTLCSVLALLAEFEKKHFCIFVDGLDEALEESQGPLVSLIRELSLLKRVKICVSSRPEARFAHAFKTYPSLSLQELSRGDIREVTEAWFAQQRVDDPDCILSTNEADALSTQVIDKAEGIFLWVRLALASMEAGLSYGESSKDLETRLQELPTELKELFAHVLQRIPPRYRVESARYIKLMRASRKVGLTKLNTKFVALTEISAADEHYDGTWDKTMLQKRFGRVEKRVTLRTAGMLELGQRLKRQDQAGTEPKTPTKLRFVYRTAEEYLNTERHCLSPVLEEDANWCAARELARAAISVMSLSKLSETNPSEPHPLFSNHTLPRVAMSCLQLAQQQNTGPEDKILETLVSGSVHVIRKVTGQPVQDPEAWRVLLGKVVDHQSIEKPIYNYYLNRLTFYFLAIPFINTKLVLLLFNII
ncbi:MAG: hypothetical protein Q9159_004939 [Coniocarpon cinnabarinum]